MSILSILLSVVVAAQLDSTQMWVGQQSALNLSATIEAGEQVEFPVYGEDLQSGIELVGRTNIDTVRLSDGRLQLKQTLTITSFQDSLFLINPIPFVSGEETIYTDQIALNVVQPFVIDTADNAIADIKPIYNAPIWWWGIIRWILLALGIVALGVGVYFLVKYLRKRYAGREQEVEPEVVEQRPAEEVAIEKLNAIKEQKIWQQGRQKEYHTELTDVVREYIARRFSISSQEQTSGEILADIKPQLSEKKEVYVLLKRMLSLADLVKFAKWQPAPDENEQSLVDAYHFVEQTTIKEEQTQTEES